MAWRRECVLAAVLACCASEARASTEARDRARKVLKAARCGQCHDSSVSVDNARALAVYDLVEPEWAAHMKDAQLPRLLSRLKSASAADQKIVSDFIAAELRRRAQQVRRTGR
jgi:hypothetical protein